MVHEAVGKGPVLAGPVDDVKDVEDAVLVNLQPADDAMSVLHFWLFHSFC